jgi:hypothetical protein
MLWLSSGMIWEGTAQEPSVLNEISSTACETLNSVESKVALGSTAAFKASEASPTWGCPSSDPE